MAASQVSSPNPSALGGFLGSSTAADYRAADPGFGKLLVAFLGAAERTADGLAIIAGVYCAYALYRLLGLQTHVRFPASTVLLSAGAFALLFVILLERRGAYRAYVGLLAVRDTERILRVTVESFLLALLAAYFTTQPISRPDCATGCGYGSRLRHLRQMGDAPGFASSARQGIWRPQSGDCRRRHPWPAYLTLLCCVLPSLVSNR
jgi:hypothetical protein